MPNSKNRCVDDLVFESSKQLFSAYGLEVHARSAAEFPTAGELALCAVMGFGGKQLRGALVLAATREPLEKTNPGDSTSQRDWIGELANQLMGRVKNRLLGLGVEILLATPACLSGDNLSLTPTRLRAPHVFAAGTGVVCVWLDCEHADDFDLPPGPPAEPGAAIAEGEAVLF